MYIKCQLFSYYFENEIRCQHYHNSGNRSCCRGRDCHCPGWGLFTWSLPFGYFCLGVGGSVYKGGGGRGGGLISTHSWSSILWWRLCLASDLLNLSPFSSLGVAFICIIHINYRGQGEWGGRGLITWHNWRSTCLVAVVFGIRLLNWSIFWDRGEGECTFPLCLYLYLYHYVFRCLTVILIFALSVSACLWYVV